MISMEVSSMTQHDAKAEPFQKKNFLGLACAGRISICIFISFKSFAGSSLLVLWIHVLSVPDIQV